jgi:hypothetical protein
LRSAIAHIPGTKDIEFSIPEKFVRFKFLAEKTTLQELMEAMNGKYKRFESRLVLKQERVGQVKGVRAISWPDQDGLVLITFKSELKTLLPDLLRAARDAGNPLVDPPAKQANLRL